MLNRLIRISLDNRVAVLVIAAILLVLGVVTTVRSDIDIFPDLNSPTVAIMTEAPGFSPEDVEQLVTYPVETSLMGASGVRRVRSSSMPGYSVVWVEFDWSTSTDAARRSVTERLMTLPADLPAGVASPVIGPQSSILGEIFILGLTSDSISAMDLRTIADTRLKPQLTALQGVSQVTVIGGEEEEIRIELDASALQVAGLTLDQVTEAVTDMCANAGGGVMNAHGNEYMLRAMLASADPAVIASATVGSDASGRPVTLADVARVSRGAKEPVVGKASVKGREAVLLTVTKQPHVGTVPLTKRIEQVVADSNLPASVQVSTDIFRQSDFIEASIGSLQESLLVGALMVIIVLFFFLMNLRTALISIVALPLSILLTVIVLNLLGITINTMTLGGIAIAIGSLVDDAIVDVENVYRRLRERREGVSVMKVVFEASREVRVPVFNSSLIIIAGFLPIFFLSGVEGRMMVPLGVSFIIALLASTLVALTVTPVLCLFLLGSKKQTARELKESPFAVKLRNGYARVLPSAISHRKAWIGTTAVLFVLAVIVMLGMGRGFLPPFNEGAFTVNVSALPGISIDESDRIARLAEEIILEVPEVNTVAGKTGRAELDEHSLGSNVSEIEAPYTLSGRSRREVAADIRERLSEIPGVNIEVGQPVSHRIDAMLSGTEAQIAVKIFGPSMLRLQTIGRKVTEEMAEVSGIVDINMEQTQGRPQIDIRPRMAMLAHYGITLPEFRRWVETSLKGVAVSSIYSNGAARDVTLTLAPELRSRPEVLADLPVTTASGAVPLGEIADIISTSGPNSISRENVARRLVVSANVDGRDLDGAVRELREKLSAIDLPDGYRIDYGGQFENQQRAMTTLLLASIGAIVLIFMLVYSEFRNVSRSLIILVNMPLALIGAIFLLWITYDELNIPAIIGFLSLAGIATRNGMLLMSRYEALRAEGVGLTDRIVRGSAERLNAILMTALTSALALLPLAIRGHLPGNELQAPIAVVILGGLLSSTLLNLFVVPCFYFIISRRKKIHK
ncbi:MAG: efflux RND transporter permease subunit [Bacteroidales bacterium]|nr:efflux RND transporter permease subunit [Bacteroidales bacterium]